MLLLEGKADLMEACRHRKMKITEKPANLLETRIRAEGNLDGMDVRIDLNSISGMPGDSKGTVVFRGNLGQLLSMLARVWPVAAESREAFSPGRQNWPDEDWDRKEPREK